MIRIKLLLLTILAYVSTTLSACAMADPKIRPITAADLTPSAHDEIRQSDPHLFLAAFGDFDGDGVQDEARLMANDESATFIVQVRWGHQQHDGPRNPTVIVEEPMENVTNAALVTVPPSKNKEICYDNFEDCDDDQRRWFSLQHEGVALRYFAPGKQTIYGWNGDGFDAHVIVD